MDFSPFCKRLKMTNSLFLIQSQPYYIYTNFSHQKTRTQKKFFPQTLQNKPHSKTRNHKKISPQIITTLLYMQKFLHYGFFCCGYALQPVGSLRSK